MSSTNPFYNPDDYVTTNVDISLKNLTTRTEIQKPEPGSKKKGEENLINVVEFLDHAFLLDVPLNTCASGHQLLLAIDYSAANGSGHFQATGKVKSVEHRDDDRDEILVNLVQFEESSWKAFRGLFENRQNEIEDFFNAVKGK